MSGFQSVDARDNRHDNGDQLRQRRGYATVELLDLLLMECSVVRQWRGLRGFGKVS